ncbi:RBBP9/YdeN family alpha/beta hydrolase [Algoriphagus litoralis]|uniref:RBBP9/YdeN family alpha/beta hydrolase n=1 Tax=Algoriphagus litoralis TaxID=2202829 RepID=UPI000DBA4EFD|nr:alpha/beta fold hydrolase [Algoriphagus litoralis]
MTHYLIVPGLGNSGLEHWQTYFEESGPQFHRIQQEEWDAPACADWIQKIEESVQQFDPKEVVLIGHSLGCTAIAHWAKRFGKVVKGALLVAPSDIENPVYTFPATGFSPIPLERISFPTLVVASTDDPWVSFERAAFFASSWGSAFVSLGAAGHINVASGHGAWEEGLELLKRLG